MLGIATTSNGGVGGNRTRVRKSSTTSSTYLVVLFNLTIAPRTNTLCNRDSLSFRTTPRDTR